MDIYSKMSIKFYRQFAKAKLKFWEKVPIPGLNIRKDILKGYINCAQLRMFFNNFFNLVLGCNDIEPRYGRTRTRVFFLTVRKVPFTTCILSINFLKHLFIKSSG